MSRDTIELNRRILGIDVARGIALLGIFFVNAQFFGQPFGAVFQAHVPTNEGWPSVLAFWFTNIFCAGKFYPLFSMLFGAGLAVMYQSAMRRGESFEWTYLRRIVVLAGFGVAHILLLWYGDILLIYACIAVWMIWLARFRAKTLAIIGLSVFGVGLLLLAPLFALLTLAGSPDQQQIVEKSIPDGATRLEQYFRTIGDWNQTEPFDSRLIELERQIMSEGPFLSAMAVRMFNYLFSVVFIVLVMFWVIFPCFCWGAALMKGGFFHGQLLRQRQLFLRLGWVIGMPVSVFSAWGSIDMTRPALLIASTIGIMIVGPLMALFYLSLVLSWAESERGRRLAHWLSNLGKMALTGYLLESLLMSAVMMHWGMARFGNNTWSERFLWVLGIYLVILIFANVWMAKFQQGPLEWLWRRAIYLGQRRPGAESVS